jgi:probable rRNA maturation factor
MTKCFIDISTEQDIFPINLPIFEDAGIKMLDYIVYKETIINLSAISKYDVKSLILNVDIIITDDEEIQKLNQEYRNINQPTDVLSFALFADNPECQIVVDKTIHLGDIIISSQTAYKQACENKKSFDEEIIFLISHGLLHLLGFDHKTDEDLEFMLSIQSEMIESILKKV